MASFMEGLLGWEDPFQGFWVMLFRVQAGLEHGVLRHGVQNLEHWLGTDGFELDTTSTHQWSVAAAHYPSVCTVRGMGVLTGVVQGSVEIRLDSESLSACQNQPCL